MFPESKTVPRKILNIRKFLIFNSIPDRLRHEAFIYCLASFSFIGSIYYFATQLFDYRVLSKCNYWSSLSLEIRLFQNIKWPNASNDKRNSKFKNKDHR